MQFYKELLNGLVLIYFFFSISLFYKEKYRFRSQVTPLFYAILNVTEVIFPPKKNFSRRHWEQTSDSGKQKNKIT